MKAERTVSRENNTSSKSVEMSDYYLESTDSDDSTVGSVNSNSFCDGDESLYKIVDPLIGMSNRRIGKERSVTDTMNDSAEFHPLDSVLDQTKEKKEINMFKMYKSRKQKENKLKTTSISRIDALEEEIAMLKTEIATLYQDREVALLSSRNTRKENSALRTELEIVKAREKEHIARISELERSWRIPKGSRASASSSASTCSPVSVDSSKFNIPHIEVSSLKTQLTESNIFNEKLKRDIESMKNLITELQRKHDYSYVHTIEDGEKKESRWMDHMLGRKTAHAVTGVNDLLWSNSTRDLNLNPGQKKGSLS